MWTIPKSKLCIDISLCSSSQFNIANSDNRDTIFIDDDILDDYLNNWIHPDAVSSWSNHVMLKLHLVYDE